MNRTSSSRASGRRSGGSRRNWVFMGTLFGLLVLTSVLLKELDPGPLAPDAASSLFAIAGEQTIEQVFQTSPPVQNDRWKYIYIHQSLTPSGNALTLGQGSAGLADHFVIGNGEGSADGEVEVGHRWSQQQPAGMVPGTDGIDAHCISIDLVGDFTHSAPTATQLARVAELVTALQRKLKIGSDRVVLMSNSKTSAGVGPHFPAREFGARLLSGDQLR